MPREGAQSGHARDCGRQSMKSTLILVLVFIVAGCANHLDLGGQAFNRGQYDLAAEYWNPLAQQGNPYAQYNLGIMWEHGLGTTQRNEVQAGHWYLKAAKQGHTPSMTPLAGIQRRLGFVASAESWLNLAARWNDQTAIASLRAWAKPIPAPDLYYAQELDRQIDALRGEAALAAGFQSLGYALGCLAAGGGCSSSDTSYSYSPPAAYQGRSSRLDLELPGRSSSVDDPPIVGLGMGLCSGPGLELGLGVTGGGKLPSSCR